MWAIEEGKVQWPWYLLLAQAASLHDSPWLYAKMYCAEQFANLCKIVHHSNTSVIKGGMKSYHLIWIKGTSLRTQEHSSPWHQYLKSVVMTSNQTWLHPSTAWWNWVCSGILGKSHKCDLLRWCIPQDATSVSWNPASWTRGGMNSSWSSQKCTWSPHIVHSMIQWLAKAHVFE